MSFFVRILSRRSFDLGQQLPQNSQAEFSLGTITAPVRAFSPSLLHLLYHISDKQWHILGELTAHLHLHRHRHHKESRCLARLTRILQTRNNIAGIANIVDALVARTVMATDVVHLILIEETEITVHVIMMITNSKT